MILLVNVIQISEKSFALLTFFDNSKILDISGHFQILKILLRVGTNLYSSGSAKKAGSPSEFLVAIF